ADLMVDIVIGPEQLGEGRISDLEVMDALGVLGEIVVQVAMIDAHGLSWGFLLLKIPMPRALRAVPVLQFRQQSGRITFSNQDIIPHRPAGGKHWNTFS